MNTSKTEFLSALLDDETGEFEQRRLLDELKKDDELGDTLSRYAFIGEAMRAGNSGQRMGKGTSLLSRIQAELEDEPVYTLPAVAAGSRKIHSYRTLGIGMAAAVAAVAVGGVLFLQQAQESGTQKQLALAPAPVPAVQTLAAVDEVDVRIRQIGQIDPQTRDVLKQYVAQHVKYASTTAIAPSIRAVSYANER
jgi:sigma-E factor negative regulatory protein RseA